MGHWKLKTVKGDIALYWNHLFICSIQFVISFKQKWVAKFVYSFFIDYNVVQNIFLVL